VGRFLVLADCRLSSFWSFYHVQHAACQIFFRVLNALHPYLSIVLQSRLVTATSESLLRFWDTCGLVVKNVAFLRHQMKGYVLRRVQWLVFSLNSVGLQEIT
jgi:hypothetical protein